MKNRREDILIKFMPEKEPQFFKPGGVREEEKELPQPEKVPKETLSKSLQEIGQELKEKGVEERNIKMALALMKRIGALDRKIFPENPASFIFALKEDIPGDFAGFVRPEKDEKERSYQITVKNIAEYIKEEEGKKVPIFGPERQLKFQKYDKEQFLISVAAHEIRHRVQHDHSIKNFSPEDAKLVDDQLLRYIIEFYEIEFEEREKIYRRENKSEEFIKKKLGPKEFDAMVIEKFVANKLHKKPITTPEELEEIVSMIKIVAPKKPVQATEHN